MSINKKSKIFIAGHNGMVGSAILRKLKCGFKKFYSKKKIGSIKSNESFFIFKKTNLI